MKLDEANRLYHQSLDMHDKEIVDSREAHKERVAKIRAECEHPFRFSGVVVAGKRQMMCLGCWVIKLKD